MPFQLPVFNLKCRAWSNQDMTFPPRVTNVDCNLAWGRRVNVPSTGGTGFLGVPLVAMQLLVRSTADLRGQTSTTGSDAIEVPSGSGRYYICYYVDYLGMGFPNEHKCAIISQFFPFKTPDT